MTQFSSRFHKSVQVYIYIIFFTYFVLNNLNTKKLLKVAPNVFNDPSSNNSGDYVFFAEWR